MVKLTSALAWPIVLLAIVGGLIAVIAYRWSEPDPVRVPTSNLDVDPPYPPPSFNKVTDAASE